MKKDRKPAFTKKFVVIISILYSVLIVATALLFNHTVSLNSRAVRETAFESSNGILMEKASLMALRTLQQEPKNTAHAVSLLQQTCREDDDVIYAMLFSPTADDNYFRLVDKITVNSRLLVEVGKREIVQDPSGIPYLRNGLVRTVTDPEIYTKDTYSWQNVYQPIALNGKNYVIQFMFRPAATQKITAAFNSTITRSRYIMLFMSLALILSVVIVTVIFSQNHSLLMKNLARYMQKAASGDLDVNINTAGDSELNELALSFNTLIEEMKTIRENAPEQAEAPGESENGSAPETGESPDVPDEDSLLMKELFKTGVQRLKDNLTEEAITLFNIIITVRPEGFSSYFNLGVAYAKTRKYEESLAMFRKAREANPSYEMTDRYIERVERIIRKNAAVG